MTRLYWHVDSVITKITNTQMMNISNMNTQKIPISHVCSMDKRKSKRINKDETLLNVYYMDKSESESFIFKCMFYGQEVIEKGSYKCQYE